MENLAWRAAIDGSSVTMAPQAHGNLSILSGGGNFILSAEDVLRGLGDPRDHVDIQSSVEILPFLTKAMLPSA